MSRSLDLFIRSDQSLADLARELSARLADRPELHLVRAGDAWELHDGQALGRLRTHHYRDDGDLLFERYPLVLSFRVPLDDRPADTAEAALLRCIAGIIVGHHLGEALIVVDTQYRLPAGTGA